MQPTLEIRAATAALKAAGVSLNASTAALYTPAEALGMARRNRLAAEQQAGAYPDDSDMADAERVLHNARATAWAQLAHALGAPTTTPLEVPTPADARTRARTQPGREVTGHDLAAKCDEILAAHRERRQPAAWATSGPDAPDMGDLVVRSLGWDRLQVKDPTASVDGIPVSPRSGPPPMPEGCDVGDQIAEQMLAEREGREPAEWARRPLGSPSTPAREAPPANGLLPGEDMGDAICRRLGWNGKPKDPDAQVF